MAMIKQVHQEFIVARNNLPLQWFYESSNDERTCSGDSFARLLENTTLYHEES
jgi:hypothetical protein